MRKLKLQVQISIDGYVAGNNGELDWMVWIWDDEIKKYVTEITEPVDTILLGRKLAEGFIPHWAAIPEGEEAWGTHKMNKTKKVVFTKTMVKTDWKNTVLANGDLVEEVINLKQQEGKDIIVYGGATFVSSLIKAGLIDELHLFVNPVALGRGLSIFNKIDKAQYFVLKKAKIFECGIALLQYKQKNNKLPTIK